MVPIEAITVAYLADLGVDAHGDAPSVRPPAFVTVERSGGGVDSAAGLDSPVLTLQAWAPTRPEAERLMCRVCEAVLAMPDHVGEVCDAEVTGMYNFPAQEERCARYQAVAALTCYI